MDEISVFQERDYEAVWRDAPCGLVTLDAELAVINANPMAIAILNCKAAAVSGTPFVRFVAEDGAAKFHGAIEACRRDPSAAVTFDLTLAGAAALHLSLQARASANGRHIALCLIVPSVRPDRHSRSPDELRDAELAASIVAASNDAILSMSLEGTILSWNSGAEQLYGYTACEAIGQSHEFIVPPAHRPESIERMGAVLLGENVYFQTERVPRSGDAIPVAISGGPMHDREGRIVGLAAIHRDISAQLRHEAQLRFVMRELAHRTKNLLAIIQSIERQTARGVATTEEFHERFSSRLQALAASHDLLVEANWAGARIGDLIERQLAAFSDEIGGRILLSGPSLRLSPEVAQTIGLALHELATNATKYGALSTPAGRVSVSWGVSPDAGEGAPRFRIDWRESGGPSVTVPTRRGFGSLAIEKLAAQALNGKAELSYLPDGIHWTLSSDPAHVEVGG